MLAELKQRFNETVEYVGWNTHWGGRISFNEKTNAEERTLIIEPLRVGPGEDTIDLELTVYLFMRKGPREELRNAEEMEWILLEVERIYNALWESSHFTPKQKLQNIRGNFIQMGATTWNGVAWRTNLNLTFWKCGRDWEN